MNDEVLTMPVTLSNHDLDRLNNGEDIWIKTGFLHDVLLKVR